MLTQSTYINFLLNTPRNYTGTHLAAHLPQVSHDQAHRFLRDNTFSSSQLRELVQPLLADSPEAFLLVDDSVFEQVVKAGTIEARTLLFDRWYASSENLKVMHRAGWTFFTTLKSNRLVRVSKASGYQSLDTLPPPAAGWSRGVEVRVQQVPFGVKLFQLVATDGSIEWVITNPLAAHLNREMVIDAVQVRWQVEEFPRSFKQLTGSEKCQCRQAQAQRNHLACCYLAWVSLRQHARAIGRTRYQAACLPWAEWLRQQLQKSSIPVLLPETA